MKTAKGITIIILSSLMFFGLVSTLLDNGEEERKMFENAIAQAKVYEEKGLYQLAIKEYEIAINIQDSEELRDMLLNVYEKRYEEAPNSVSQYLFAVENAINMYPSNSKYYVIIPELYMKYNEYQKAYVYLDKAKTNGIKSKEMDALYTKVKYSFNLDWYTYSDFLPATNGLYAVQKDEKWGYIDENGLGKTDIKYSFVSQVGDEGIRILYGDQKNIIDKEDVVRGKLSFEPEEAGVYSEGLISMCNDKSYGYYDSYGEYQFGEYNQASKFSNGKAAVKEKQWLLIDKEGKKVSKETYQDIRINNDDSYIYRNVMIAQKDGKYKLYDQDENLISTFECDDVDIITDDELIAYKQGGKWGFVDTKGEVKIEPTYDEAKSFSNGLAAVCKGDKWGFIDLSGKLVIDYMFIDADYFNCEMNCMVKTSNSIWQLLCINVEF